MSTTFAALVQGYRARLRRYAFLTAVIAHAPSAPGIETTPDSGTEPKHEILPPYSVILHNDDHNEMLHVVGALMKSVPKLGATRATQIMLEAHNRGKAIVTTCPLELAELYRDRLESFGLTATIEKA